MNQSEQLDDLLFIKKIITDSQRIIAEDGHSLIFWGILVVIGQIVTYTIFKFQLFVNYFAFVWPILVGFGWIYTIILNIKKYGKQKTYTFAGKIMGALWRGVGIAAMVLGFVPALTGAINSGAYINPLICSVMGVGYMVSGYLYGKNWLSYLSYIWWAGSIYMFWFPYLHTLLLMAAMMTCLTIVPGLYLRSQYKKLNIPNERI